MTKGDRYRVWLADETSWQPGPVFPHLALAIDRAKRLAVTRWVAIELPTREWHVFDESNSTRLGPAQFARGSNLDLDTRAAAAEEKPASPREYRRATTGNSAYRIRGLRKSQSTTARPGSGDFAASRTPTTQAGLGPEGNNRAPASSEQPRPVTPSGSRPNPRPTGKHVTGHARRRPSPSTARPVNERRACERFAGNEVLGDPSCYVDGHQVEVSDVSESGLQLSASPRMRLSVGNRLVLSFADRHGRFDLIVRVVWARGGHAGVQIEDGGANLVGKMFLRKLIGQLVKRRETLGKRRRPRRT